MNSAHRNFLIFVAGAFLCAGGVVCAQEESRDAAKSAPKDDSARTVMVDGVAEPVYHAGKGIPYPQQIYSPDPEFSEEARRRKIQGVVKLSIVVTSKGETADIRVVNGRGYGLDEKAVDAVRQWKFRPATKDGKPVSVVLNVEVDFRLYQRP